MSYTSRLHLSLQTITTLFQASETSNIIAESATKWIHWPLWADRTPNSLWKMFQINALLSSLTFRASSVEAWPRWRKTVTPQWPVPNFSTGWPLCKISSRARLMRLRITRIASFVKPISLQISLKSIIKRWNWYQKLRTRAASLVRVSQKSKNWLASSEAQ